MATAITLRTPAVVAPKTRAATTESPRVRWALTGIAVLFLAVAQPHPLGLAAQFVNEMVPDPMHRQQSMHERQARAAQQQEQAFREYVQDAAGSGGNSADQLAKLAQLKDSGAITDAEFQAGKAKILS